MANILIFGAGSMGTAFSFPCSDKNHSVVVIGTHLENNFIDQINSKRIKHALSIPYFFLKRIIFNKINNIGCHSFF